MTAAVSKGSTFTSVAPRLGFVGAFDGMRGIGVLIVLFGHIFPEDTDSLNPIVDFFFVISAFLIVSLLMQEHRDNGRIDLRRFYTRRAIRLLPNSYACMAAWMLIWGVIKLAGITGEADAMEQVNAIPGNVLAAATYVYHLVYPIGGKPGPLVQFWTLSLEEQFYLVVGFAVVWLLARQKRVAWASGVMVALVVWIGWSRWNVDLGPWPGKEYSLDLWTRGLRLFWMARPDALLLGVLLAFLNARIPDPLPARTRRTIVTLAWVGTVVATLVMLSSLGWFERRGVSWWVPGIPRDDQQIKNVGGEMWCALKVGEPYRPCTEELWIFRWAFTVFDIAVLPLTLCMARCKDASISRFLSLRWFRKVGEMSYSLYVWHLLAFVIVEILLGGLGLKAQAVAKVLAAFAMAWVAHRYIDRAVLGIKLRFSSEQVVLDRRTGEEVDVSKLDQSKKPDD